MWVEKARTWSKPISVVALVLLGVLVVLITPETRGNTLE
jgi:hypothetical protein